MGQSQFDVVVVGAGCAGLAAAIGLARAGFAVAVVEAAVFPGAENWSGCVYFCENLAHPDILGPEGVEALAWERRLVERGLFTCDGHGLLGMTYRDPAAFRHCYTVLRPIFDHHLAQVARGLGVGLLCSTTAESLIREAGRVVGICTNRGPLYGDLVFLAEGDASHLVTREGYERFADPRESPKFLQGIKQIIELPPGAIEERFQVGPEEGIAYEMLLRNGTLRGRNVRLNMGGFIYANRRSLSIGLVLPAENLHEGFGGDPSLLVEWLESLPALAPWLRGGKRGAFGAKIIRGGGAKDIPILIDDGLAIGGAASAIGIDFPYPNFTGPATAMGLLITRAAKNIRAEGGEFTRENLQKHYLEPLQRTHYWQDVEFLRRWPGYVKKTSVFFGPNIDLALGSAYIWTRPKHGRIAKWVQWLRLLGQVSHPMQWPELQEDMDHLSRALRLRTVVKPPSLGQLLLDGTVNALRDIFRHPRANLARAGRIRLHYSVSGGVEPSEAGPAMLVRWLNRLAPVLASAAKMVYANDTTPLSVKLQAAVRLLFKQVNVLDLLTGAFFSLAAGVTSTILSVWDRLGRLFRKAKPRQEPSGIYAAYARAARQTTDLTPVLTPAAQHWEGRLAQLAYQTVKPSHIHVLWPQSLPGKNAIAEAGLWNVCPAHVYEARVTPLGQMQIVVSFENCIKCETCWRTSPLVDWGRDGRQRFIYAVRSPVQQRLIEAAGTASLVRPGMPHGLDWWAQVGADLTLPQEENVRAEIDGQHQGEAAELNRLLMTFENKLLEFEEALEEEPRTIDRARGDYLEMLARYAHQTTVRMVEIVRAGNLADGLAPTTALAARAEERLGRACNRRFAWAAADGRQMRWHLLVGLRRYLQEKEPRPTVEISPPSATKPWLRTEDDAGAIAEGMSKLTEAFDAALPATIWRDLERGGSLGPAQDQALRDLAAQVPEVDPANLAGTLHPPLRKAILAELGRRDPSIAYRVASHLWARDLAHLVSGSSPLTSLAQRWARGENWASFAALEPLPGSGSRTAAEAVFVPAAHARSLLVLWEDRLLALPMDEKKEIQGLTIQPVGSLGLRGAGLARIQVTSLLATDHAVNVDADRVRRIWHVLSAADLISIGFGMADLLCKRALAHATGRVQFPGLFHDEEARDTIGKFGAVKKMIAEMAAARYAIETIDHALSPGDFSAASVERAGLLKAVVADLLGTAPGSLSYNAGQIFGGTGFSEDDVLAKLYRDAAAWRFLGITNRAVFLGHGEALLRGWRLDGQKLAGLDGEAQLFDDLAQRKALQAELDEIRVIRSRVRGMVGEWLAWPRSSPALLPGEKTPHAPAEIAERLGRQDAGLLVGKAILLRTHARLEEGLPAEIETVLVRVLLDRERQALDELESRVEDYLAGAGSTGVAARIEASGPPVTLYADFLAAPHPYDSGDFLVKPFDFSRPRYVPEMNEADPELAGRDREIRTLFQEQFGLLREGLPFERFIENRHRPEASDLDFCRKHGFFRMPIPPSLGGEGRRKVDYYLVTTNAQRLADVAISLTIQANTSIGTTPVLLARDKDIPKALKNLGSKPGDKATQREIAEKGAELARRREACDMFLRWVAAGQISAFALTEPSAGSDTARVATRARLRSVPVEVEADGVFRFVPEGAKQPRLLLDARRLEFSGDGAFYRWSEEAEPAPIHFDEYDYETDDPRKMRYCDFGKRRVHFTDIAQLRERDGRLWYDYFELMGAKMWITNGRMCGIMCMYAKTDQGVTGFIVDRHAEGLVVGKDEDKLGQCGSPTNELSLQAVRVPRENVLGLEGRGQVNALETLNVGRAGLAMSAMAQMAGLIDMSRSFALARHGVIPNWVEWRLQSMEEDRFTAEALAHDVIGLFEHPQTRSARLESAISKMLVSELLHRVIETAEEIHELAGQTTDHLVEKRKRDARVLNIYEGTNEVQRFSILKDLAAEVAPRWKNANPTETTPTQSGYVRELEALKAATRGKIDAALALFGQDLWKNPSLQANCFLLAEVAAWLAAAESTLARLAWLARRIEKDARPAARVELGQRALGRCFKEARLRLRRFDDALNRLRHGYYAPEIRAAALLFDQLGKPESLPPLRSEVNRPLSILVIVEPSAAEVPYPYVDNGRLLEPYFSLTEPDRSALEMALRIRDEARAFVSITVAAVGPPVLAQVLREVLNLGVDRALLLITQKEAVPPDRAAAALAGLVRPQGQLDLILGGSGGSTGEEGLLALLTGVALGAAAVSSAVDLAVNTSTANGTVLLLDVDRLRKRIRPLPAVVVLEAGADLRSFTVSGYLAGLNKQVEAHRWVKEIEYPQISFIEREIKTVPGGASDKPHPLRPEEAGQWVLREAGLTETGAGPRESFAGPIRDVSEPGFLHPERGSSKVLIVLATDPTGRFRPEASNTVRAGFLVAQLQEKAGAPTVVLLAPPEEETQRKALAQLETMFRGYAVLVPLPVPDCGDEVKCRLLVASLERGLSFPGVIVGESWTEPAFAKLGSRSPLADGIVSRVVRFGLEKGGLLFETSRARAKLRLRHARAIPSGKSLWITLAENAVIEPCPLSPIIPFLQVDRWVLPGERLNDRDDIRHLLEELKQDAGLARLADADFIIDVGFGVGNRDGYEEVIEPLERALHDLGVRSLIIGGSRKVTEELHLLPADRQIGQSGVSVNPRVILAIGISGAPQHLDYIGPRAKILAFNRDPEAPLMTLNQRQAQPRVYPVVGDLFETVPALIAALRQEVPAKHPSGKT